MILIHSGVAVLVVAYLAALTAALIVSALYGVQYRREIRRLTEKVAVRDKLADDLATAARTTKVQREVLDAYEASLAKIRELTEQIWDEAGGDA